MVSWCLYAFAVCSAAGFNSMLGRYIFYGALCILRFHGLWFILQIVSTFAVQWYRAFELYSFLVIFVNKTNLVHELFLVYLSISTCVRRLWAHHQEKQLCFCDTLYLLFCVDDCLVCRVEYLLFCVDDCLVCRVEYLLFCVDDCLVYRVEYSLFCVDDCLVCRVEFHNSTLHTGQSSTQNNKYQVSHKHSCFSWRWAHSRPKHAETDKYTKTKLCTKLVLFTRLYRDARSMKHKIW
jgi:hypothetical protein